MSNPDLGSMVWASPPPADRGKYDWSAIAQHLREHPGEWLRVFEDGPTSTANTVRQGDVSVLLPRDGFEVTTRNNTRYPRRRCTLYLRWVPPEGET